MLIKSSNKCSVVLRASLLGRQSLSGLSSQYSCFSYISFSSDLFKLLLFLDFGDRRTKLPVPFSKLLFISFFLFLLKLSTWEHGSWAKFSFFLFYHTPHSTSPHFTPLPSSFFMPWRFTIVCQTYCLELLGGQGDMFGKCGDPWTKVCWGSLRPSLDLMIC